jgi:uncharacterized OB-fold protein
VSFTLPVCADCGRAVFPPRAICPHCGGRTWTRAQTATGTVEELTERDGTRIASVRTDLGPVLVARADATVERGDVVALDADDGVPVVGY